MTEEKQSYAIERSGSSYLATDIVNERSLAIAQRLRRATSEEKQYMWCLENGMPFSLVWSKSLYALPGGGVSMDGKLIASQIRRRDDKYDYDVVNWTDESCTVIIHRYSKRLQKWVECEPVTYTKEDAKLAGLWDRPNWQQYPRNHLFYMAISLAQKVYAGDVFETPVYASEEIQQKYDIVDAEISIVENVEPPPQAQIPPEYIGKIIELYGPRTFGIINRCVTETGKTWPEVVAELPADAFEAWTEGVMQFGEDAIYEANGGNRPENMEELGIALAKLESDGNNGNEDA